MQGFRILEWSVFVGFRAFVGSGHRFVCCFAHHNLSVMHMLLVWRCYIIEGFMTVFVFVSVQREPWWEWHG